MKRLLLVALALFAICHLPIALSQTPTGQQDVSARSVTFNLANPPQVVPFASVTLIGNPGPGQFYYWIVSNYSIGNSSPAGPFPGNQAANSFGAGNGFEISWAPAVGATSYDVLRTTTITPPTGACNCAVATAQTGFFVNDTSNSLNAYTVNTFDPGTATIQLQNVSNVLNILGNVSLGRNSLTAGAATLGTINGILTVDGTKYTTIDGAYADCPSTGCIIRVKAGTLACPTTAIMKPLILEGAGPGGFSTAADSAYTAQTTLTNASQNANCITIGGSLGTSAALNGVVIRDLSIQGNKSVAGATTGDGIAIVGGDSTTQLTNVLIDNVFVHDAKGNGISIKENAFGINIRDSQIAKNGSNGIAVSNSGTGGPSQIRLARVFDWLNTGDGLNMNGTNVHDVSSEQSTFANNTNGVNVVVGSTIARFIGTDADNFESNSNAGVLLSDGFAHAVRDSTFPADGVQLFGVDVNFPAGASTVLTQLTLDNNSFGTNLTKDVNIASAKNVMIQPQASNNYTYNDASGNAVRLDTTTFGGLTFTGGGNGFSPTVNGSNFLGDRGKAWAQIVGFSVQIPELTAPTPAASFTVCYADSTAHVEKCSYNNGSFFAMPQTIGSGTATMTTALIASAACGATVTVAATGVATTDTVSWSYNAAPLVNPGELVISAWPTANNVNFQYCNPTAGGITPNAATLNWRVSR